MGTAVREKFLPRRATWFTGNDGPSTFLSILLSIFLCNVSCLLVVVFPGPLSGFSLLLGFSFLVLMSIGSLLFRRSLFILTTALDVPNWAISGDIGTYEGLQFNYLCLPKSWLGFTHTSNSYVPPECRNGIRFLVSPPTRIALPVGPSENNTEWPCWHTL